MTTLEEAYAEGRKDEREEWAWRPIETAPRDGTILVWHREYGSVTGHILVGDLWGVYAPGVPMLFQKHLTPAPTHWMPIPEPPK